MAFLNGRLSVRPSTDYRTHGLTGSGVNGPKSQNLGLIFLLSFSLARDGRENIFYRQRSIIHHQRNGSKETFARSVGPLPLNLPFLATVSPSSPSTVGQSVIERMWRDPTFPPWLQSRLIVSVALASQVCIVVISIGIHRAGETQRSRERTTWTNMYSCCESSLKFAPHATPEKEEH